MNFMRWLLCFLPVLAGGQSWVMQTSGTTASLRGLSVVDARTVWASGTGGTILRTTDGTSWKATLVAGAEALDFRDVEAFDSQRAFLLSSGPGAASTVRWTEDGGVTFSRLFPNPDEKGFWDAIAFWDPQTGILLGDPVNGQFTIFTTRDGGRNWARRRTPPAKEKEGAFAASGTCLVMGKTGEAWFATGGPEGARVFHSLDYGVTWTVTSTGMRNDAPAAGIFSLAFAGPRGIAVGGEYTKPRETTGVAAMTTNAGAAWQPAQGPAGYRSGVAYSPALNLWVAVGTSGSDYSNDDGRTWKTFDNGAFNAVAFAGDVGWAVGPQGRVARFSAKATDALLLWMDTIAQRLLDAREQAVAAIATPRQAQQRQAWARQKMLDLIGGLPSTRTPLNPRTTGRLENKLYRMDKVIFESLPGFFVTANVYRPTQPGPHPAVLLSAGHTITGKTENHRIAAVLAAKGFIAMTYDPIGLGERVQAFDRQLGRGMAGCCANEHLQAGAQSLLIGQSVARYFVWDAMRALDYLESQPDVDATRIGAAGCSGGGCVTTYIAALDDRVKAAAPACFLNSLRLLFSGPYPDSEMSLPGFLAAGLDHADFLTMKAPMPWRILATDGDFFTPAGVDPVYREAKRWYDRGSHGDRVSLFMAPGPHGTPQPTREALYEWMIRWLKNGAGDAREIEVPLYADRELLVTASGQVENEPGSRKLHDLIRDEYRALRSPRGFAELKAELLRLGIGGARKPGAVHFSEADGVLRLEVEPGVDITAKLHVPAGGGKHPALVIVKDRNSEALAQMAARRGAIALEVEPRDSPSGYDNRPFLGNWMTNARANSIGLNLPALRAQDILRAVDWLSTRGDVDAARISGIAREARGIWMLLAAAMDTRLSRVWLDRTPHSYASSLDVPVNANLFDGLIPGFLLHWDIADLAAAVQPRQLLRTDPIDWAGKSAKPSGDFRYRYASQGDDEFLALLLR